MRKYHRLVTDLQDPAVTTATGMPLTLRRAGGRTHRSPTLIMFWTFIFFFSASLLCMCSCLASRCGLSRAAVHTMQSCCRIYFFLIFESVCVSRVSMSFAKVKGEAESQAAGARCVSVCVCVHLCVHRLPFKYAPSVFGDFAPRKRQLNRFAQFSGRVITGRHAFKPGACALQPYG